MPSLLQTITVNGRWQLLFSLQFLDFYWHLRSSVYYPTANGAIERFNRVLKDCMQMEECAWKAATRSLQNVWVTPFQLPRKRKMHGKMNVLPISRPPKSHGQVKETVQQKQQKSKEYTDKKRGARVPKFQVNDMVPVCRPEHVQKGSPRFSDPLTVVWKVGSRSCTGWTYGTWECSSWGRWTKTKTKEDRETHTQCLQDFLR